MHSNEIIIYSVNYYWIFSINKLSHLCKDNSLPQIKSLENIQFLSSRHWKHITHHITSLNRNNSYSKISRRKFHWLINYFIIISFPFISMSFNKQSRLRWFIISYSNCTLKWSKKGFRFRLRFLWTRKFVHFSIFLIVTQKLSNFSKETPSDFAGN